MTRRGVTIVEMVVVLTIIGIIAAGVAPALRSLGGARDPLVESRGVLISVLTNARRRAIAHANTVTLTIDPRAARYWIGEPELVDSATALALPEGVTLTSDVQRVHFSFTATGVVSGEPIAIRAGPRVQPIALDPWTGTLVERAMVTDDAR